MSLVSLRGVTFGWGGRPLIEKFDLEIEPGERIGLLGRNGAGKSTLLKLILGEVEPDEGEVWREKGLRLGQLVQSVPEGNDLTVFQVACQDLDLPRPDDSSWQLDQAVSRQLKMMGLNEDEPFAAHISQSQQQLVFLKVIGLFSGHHQGCGQSIRIGDVQYINVDRFCLVKVPECVDVRHRHGFIF